MSVCGVLLAAGQSSRMKPDNKLLLSFGHHTMVEESLRQLTNSSLAIIMIVLGYEYKAMHDLLVRYESERVSLIENAEYQSGRASSIRRAIESTDPETEALLFLPADKPMVRTDLINRAHALWDSSRPPILTVRTPYGRGHPIIFDRSLFDELLALDGDQVGQELIEKYDGRVGWLEDSVEQINVNTRADYERLLRQTTGSPAEQK